LELKIKRHLGLEHILFLGNGTIALQLAIKALNLSGKIITTPFSYIATCSSIVWEGCKPVFVDIEQNGYNIDPKKIEAAISPEVTGIVATHCYGFPCDVDAIDKIAKRHGLKVIYDGAHAFGSTIKGRSIFQHGDVSTCSFHATKLFHTVEGGMVATNSHELLRKLALMRNFGHSGPETFNGVGINGKNSEFHAGMGIVNLRYHSVVAAQRRMQCEVYAKLLSDTDLLLPDVENAEWNFAYFPVLFVDELQCSKVKIALENSRIFPRRYFYPSLDGVNNWGESNCHVSKDKSSRVLCLPLYHTLSLEELQLIVRRIKRTLRYD
jgi:dTDP-4-amino-4,6-dideoxygalactose transaminase